MHLPNMLPELRFEAESMPARLAFLGLVVDLRLPLLPWSVLAIFLCLVVADVVVGFSKSALPPRVGS